MKGKNYSLNNSSGKRKKSDFYETPYSMTRQLLDAEYLPNSIILEPACGNKAIVRILHAYGYSTHYYDISDGKDFLEEKEKFDYIITNPPFSLAYEFIQKAKEVAIQKFIFLLPLSYLHGKERYDNIWTDNKFPLKRIYVFTRYPMLGDPLREDERYRTGMMVYAWYVWERGWCGYPEIHWLDNNDFVLKGK